MTGQAIGAVLPLALGVALSPVPIIAVVLMLATRRARSTGVAFVVGWVVGLAVVGTVVLVVSGGADAGQGSTPATWVGVVELLLGVALLGLAVVQWRRRPRTAEPELPGWMASIDTFTPLKAAGLGVALSALNPKNLLITVGAGAAIAETGVDRAGAAVALAVFVLLGTVGPAVPLVIYLVMGRRAVAMLASLRTWMARYNAVIMVVLIVVIASKLVGDGLSAVAP